MNKCLQPWRFLINIKFDIFSDRIFVMRYYALVTAIVFSLASIAFKMWRTSTEFDSRVQHRLVQAGYGKIKDVKELMMATRKMDSLSNEQLQALMCVPNEQFRRSLMNSDIKNVANF